MYVSGKNIQVTLLKITKACSLLSIRWLVLCFFSYDITDALSKDVLQTLLCLQGKRSPNLSHNDPDRMTPSEK